MLGMRGSSRLVGSERYGGVLVDIKRSESGSRMIMDVVIDLPSIGVDGIEFVEK